MNYAKKRADVLRTLKKDGALATVKRTASNGSVTTTTCWAIRIERRIGDLKKYDESIEIGDYKYIVEGAADVKEADLFIFGGETRIVSRTEALKPADTTIFSYVWTREA